MANFTGHGTEDLRVPSWRFSYRTLWIHPSRYWGTGNWGIVHPIMKVLMVDLINFPQKLLENWKRRNCASLNESSQGGLDKFTQLVIEEMRVPEWRWSWWTYIYHTQRRFKCFHIIFYRNTKMGVTWVLIKQGMGAIKAAVELKFIYVLINLLSY